MTPRRHLPYGIMQCYLPLDTSERTPSQKLLLDLHTTEEWKADLA